MTTIHTLHGNFGTPGDWEGCLPSGVHVEPWHLWSIRREFPETSTLPGFARWFNRRAESVSHPGLRLLAGYSLGGRLALQVLLDRPEAWDGALILSAHPGLTSPEERALRRESDAVWAHRCRSSPWPEVLSSWNSQPVLQSGGAAENPDGLATWKEEIADAFLGWSLGTQDFLPPLLTRFPSSAITLMAGESDSKFTALSKSLHRVLPASRLRLVPDTGHRLLREAPAEVLAELEHLISRTSGS